MRTILIVEDDRQNIELLTRLLHRDGYECLLACSRDEAIRVLQSVKLDLVLMDVQIPNADGKKVNERGGMEVIEWIRSQPGSPPLPIIAVTASDAFDDVGDATVTGCDHVVKKPVDFDQLLSAVRSHTSDRPNSRKKLIGSTRYPPLAKALSG